MPFTDHNSHGDQPSTPLDFAIPERDRDTIQLVEEAISRKDVALAFQPIVNSREQDTVAFYEGLIRVYDENRNLISAADFIPVAETRELGRILDCIALEHGLIALNEEPSLRLSVNMSARSIGYPRWMETLNRGLAADGTIAERLILEITESSAMIMPDLVTVFMADLHKRGITFALDDFGAGYTAFRYFKDFYFDVVKIDGSFIRGIHKDPNNQVLTSALVSIAQHFDMFTVAECVEGPEEAAFLSSAGIDCLQGYHFGKPLVVPPWQAREQGLRAYL